MQLQSKQWRRTLRAGCMAVFMAVSPLCMAADFQREESDDATTSSEAPTQVKRSPDGYVARQDGLREFLQAVAAHVGRPIIVSKAAANRQVSGNFDFGQGDIVGRICRQLGLISYNDGNAIYVYDAAETRNGMMVLKYIKVSDVIRFLQKSGLADARYPLRGDGDSAFYVAGPPIYVDTVLRTAESMDRREEGANDQRVEVIRLNNTFVSDRSFTHRDEAVTIPGIAAIVEKLLSGDGARAALGSGNTKVAMDARAVSGEQAGADGRTQALAGFASHLGAQLGMPLGSTPAATGAVRRSWTDKGDRDERSAHGNRIEDVRVIAYPETNSLLVRGTAEQIGFVRSMVAALDERKRHVELALWIVDVEKDDLEQLGVNWRGQVGMGSVSASLNAGTSLNTFSAIEGDRFTAAILALTRDSKANIVSRPVVLTQENVPAMFDSNRTFYTPLIAERAVDLQHVTYGTLVQVLPRFTEHDEIELSLNIEDGGEVHQAGSNRGALPMVRRTTINTVARVPRGKSLLVGGYTRGENEEHLSKIPLLGDLPLIGGAFRYRETLSKNAVRLFLIRPREITDGLDLDTPATLLEMMQEGRARTSSMHRMRNPA